ncbi:MAG: hypothetical protein NVSMB1_07350 [Polyangiales bacterium]
MPVRAIRVLDCASLVRRAVVVLELDTPSPLIGAAIGMRIVLVFRDGTRESVDLKGLGFASSTPDHAHVIIAAPKRVELSSLESIELDTVV